MPSACLVSIRATDAPLFASSSFAPVCFLCAFRHRFADPVLLPAPFGVAVGPQARRHSRSAQSQRRWCVSCWLGKIEESSGRTLRRVPHHCMIRAISYELSPPQM